MSHRTDSHAIRRQPKPWKAVRILGLILLIGLLGTLALLWAEWRHQDRNEQFERSALPGPDAPLSLAALGAEFFALDASEITERGDGRLFVLRFVEGVEFVPHYFRDHGLSSGQPAEAWAKYLDAKVVFNAGQFDENLEYLGWLKKDGTFLSPHIKSKWKGLFVSGPLEQGAWSRVVDLETNAPEIIQRYRHGLQSMMLVDDAANIRVRDSGKAASRTVVAEDAQGRILVMVSDGAITLADLARWLPKQPIGIVRAMNLDGGLESQLFIQAGDFRFEHYGQYRTERSVFEGGGPDFKYPLPVVVAVRPAQ